MHDPSADLFNAAIDKAFWALLLGVVSFGVKFLSDLAKQLRSLNSNILVLFERDKQKATKIRNLDDRYEDLDTRLDRMEKNCPLVTRRHGDVDKEGA